MMVCSVFLIRRRKVYRGVERGERGHVRQTP
jgi:hypothetical protein